MTPEEMIKVYKKNGGDVQLYEAWENYKSSIDSYQPGQEYWVKMACMTEEIITMLIDKYSADFIRDKIIERFKEKK